MYEFKELILPEHFRHASYGGFCVKPGMFYGTEKETGKLVATTGWNVNGLTNIYIQHEPKLQWNNDLWEDLYDDYGKPLITIEENDLQRISDKVKDFQKTAMDFETWADENGYDDESWDEDQIESAYDSYYFMGYPEFVIQLLKERWDLENMNMEESKVMEKIYGVSSKFDFGRWDHIVYVFENQEDADRWLETEEFDFRERELMTKKEAIELVGKEDVDNATTYER